MDGSTYQSLVDLGIALGVGALVGLQREHVGTRIAGLRTFALIGLLGGMCAHFAHVAPEIGQFVITGGVLALAWLLVAANRLSGKVGEIKPGMTTEVAALTVFITGALIASDERALGVSIGVVVTVLLQGKERLHAIAARLSEQDIRSILTFAIISLVILPVLPGEPVSFLPYGVIVPSNIWLMVVLVVGLSLGGYLAYRAVGERVGVVLTGLLGGAISSTATTAAVSRQVRRSPAWAEPGVAILLLATCAMYVRVIIEIGVVARDHIGILWPPVVAVLVLTLALAGIALVVAGRRNERIAEPQNPTDLRTALLFGFIYACVLLVVAWANDKLGERGTLVAAAISGLTDMDAITLSTSRLVSEGKLAPGSAWRAVLLAAISNMAFKSCIAGALGGWRLLIRLLVPFAICAAGAGALILFWPAA